MLLIKEFENTRSHNWKRNRKFQNMFIDFHNSLSETDKVFRTQKAYKRHQHDLTDIDTTIAEKTFFSVASVNWPW